MKSILALSLVVLLASCQNSHKERVIKTDTVTHMMVLKSDGSLLYFSKALVVVKELRGIPKDSTSSTLEWHTDTVVAQAFVPIDTARDVKKKPIYDSLTKRYKIDSGWQNIPSYDPKTVQLRYFK